MNNTTSNSSIPPVILYPAATTTPVLQSYQTTTAPEQAQQQVPQTQQAAVLQASSTTNSVSTIDPSAENVSTLAEVMEKLYRAENEAMDRVHINTIEHKYPKAFFRVSVFSGLLLFLVLIIWMLTTPYGYPWFIHIFHAGAMAISVAYVAGSKSADIGKKLFNLHLAWVVSTVAMFIIANIYSSKYPWSIYPCAVFIYAFCIHAMAVKTPQMFNLFTVHALVWFVCNIVMFVAYCYGSTGFPWNLIVLGVWTFVLISHFIIHKTIWPKIYDATIGKLNSKKNQDATVTSNDSVGNTDNSTFDHLHDTNIMLPPVVPASVPPTNSNMPPLYPQPVQGYSQV